MKTKSQKRLEAIGRLERDRSSYERYDHYDQQRVERRRAEAARLRKQFNHQNGEGMNANTGEHCT